MLAKGDGRTAAAAEVGDLAVGSVLMLMLAKGDGRTAAAAAGGV